MRLQDLPNYESMQVRLIPLPKAEPFGDGWWRVSWEITTSPREVPGDFHLPAPPRELDDLALIVSVLPRASGQLTVEVLSRYERLLGAEIAYISLVMQAILALYQEVAIDGYKDHPILRMARESRQDMGRLIQ